MLARKLSILRPFFGLLCFIVLLAAVGIPGKVYADEPVPTPDQGTCIQCHDNLYFLHDTGKWFCLKEAPMACTNCHGGDPTATTQEIAHTHRSAYPILNEDISKCLECHPKQASERVAKFDRVAKINSIIIAQPNQPDLASPSMPPAKQATQKSSLYLAIEFLIPFLVTGFVLAVYFIRKNHQV